MAGHMGATRVTAQNIEILQTDDEQGLILVRGSIPGAKNSYVTLRDAVKIMLPQNAALPAKVKTTAAAEKPAATETEGASA
jgi:large subunit ribosomal protein L3